MSNLENANVQPPAAIKPPRTWDFMETAFVTLIAYGVFTLTSTIARVIMVLLQGGTEMMSLAQLEALASEGRWQGVAFIVSSPLTISVLWIAIRVARRGFAEYLALNWPSPAEAARGFLIFTGVLLIESMIAYSAGAADVPVDRLLIVKSASGLLMLLIGGCIAAPIMEEFIIRGFLFRGWSQSFLGPIGAIVMTSAVWAATHTQYDWFAKLEIFGMGLALGYARWRSNSTWLTAMMHSTLNIFLFFNLGPYV